MSVWAIAIVAAHRAVTAPMVATTGPAIGDISKMAADRAMT